MKRLSCFFSTILVVAMITMSTASAYVQFTDIESDHPNSKAIQTLLNERIIDGVRQDNGTYKFLPEKNVTRAEAAKMITKALLGNDADKLEPATSFIDVPTYHWASKYITYAAETGIVSGYGGMTFRPEGLVSYAEVVKMLVYAKGYGHLYESTLPWYDGYFKLASRLGITKDIECEPTANAPRWLVVQLIYNMKYENVIPKLYIEGEMSEMLTKQDERQISVRYEDNINTFSCFAKIKLQGTSSLNFEKKNYTINFYEDDTYSQKNKVDLGWGSQSKYCMKANWIDKTHARNVVTARLVGQMQNKYGLLTEAPNNGAVDGYPIEIYINDQFHGLYTMNIPKDEWMFGMDSKNPDHIVVGGETWGPETLFNAMPNFEMWEVEVGGQDDYTLERLNRLFDFVINSSDEEFKAHINEYISLSAAMNYYIMMDFSYLADNMGKNMLLATYDGQLWYPCLYDLDSSWGTNPYGTGLTYYGQHMIGYYNRLFKRIESCFSAELADRYFDLREDVLTKNNILLQFNAFVGSIPETSYARELLRWGPDLPGHGISQIDSYLDDMIPKLDSKYEAMLGSKEATVLIPRQ